MCLILIINLHTYANVLVFNITLAVYIINIFTEIRKTLNGNDIRKSITPPLEIERVYL